MAWPTGPAPGADSELEYCYAAGRKSPFKGEDIAAIRSFAAENFFDISWLPGISTSDVNRFNQLDREFLYEGALALLGPERDDSSSATSSPSGRRPTIGRISSTSSAGGPCRTPGAGQPGGAAMLDWRYPILLPTLVQAVIFSAVLILLPLWVAGPCLGKLRTGCASGSTSLLWYSLPVYRDRLHPAFVLFLGHPFYAVAVVLAGFLVFAGLGSAASARWAASVGRGSAVRGSRSPSELLRSWL